MSILSLASRTQRGSYSHFYECLDVDKDELSNGEQQPAEWCADICCKRNPWEIHLNGKVVSDFWTPLYQLRYIQTKRMLCMGNSASIPCSCLQLDRRSSFITKSTPSSKRPSTFCAVLPAATEDVSSATVAVEFYTAVIESIRPWRSSSAPLQTRIRADCWRDWEAGGKKGHWYSPAHPPWHVPFTSHETGRRNQNRFLTPCMDTTFFNSFPSGRCCGAL